VNVIPFDPDHIREMQLQDQQARIVSLATVQYLRVLKHMGPCASAEVDGRIIACAGVALEPYGSGTLWSFISRDAGKHFIVLDRAVRRMLSIPNVRRIDATTEAGFSQGCRWLEMLGFEFEGVMRKYGPDGSDHVRYAKVA